MATHCCMGSPCVYCYPRTWSCSVRNAVLLFDFTDNIVRYPAPDPVADDDGRYDGITL